MKRVFRIADKVINTVAEWAIVIAGLLIIVMGVLTTYGVVRRYAFGSPEPYSYELAVIFLVACILLAIPAVQKNRGNLRVDFIVARLTPRWHNIFENIIVPVVAMGFVGVVIWKSWGVFHASFTTHETSQSAWQEPLWPLKLLVPLCMGWLFLILMSQMIHGIVHLIRGTVREDTRIQL